MSSRMSAPYIRIIGLLCCMYLLFAMKGRGEVRGGGGGREGGDDVLSCLSVVDIM